MATDVGAVQYTVDADTAAMLKAEVVVNKSLNKIVKDFDQADKAINKFKRTQKSAGNTINALGQVLDKNGNIVKSLTIEYRKLASQAGSSFDKLSTKVSKSAKGVNKGIAGMSRGAGQAGIQLQQFIGQVQGGQNALLAFSQQGADLGIVLGLPLVGAVVGISASIIGLLLPALFKSKDKMKELEDISKQLGKTLKETADGSDVLSERLLKLAKRSESLAKIEISKGINNSEDQIKKSIEAITESVDSGSVSFLEGFSKTFDGIRKSSTKTFDEIVTSTKSFMGLMDRGLKGSTLNDIGQLERKTRELRKEFGLNRRQAVELGIAVSNVFTDKSILSVKSLENVLSDLNEETGGSNKKLVKLSSALVPLFQKVFDGVDNINLLRQAFTDLGKALKETEKETSNYDETVKGIVQGLRAQIIALEDGEEAAFRFATAQQLGLKNVELITGALDEEITALFKLKKAKDKAREEKTAKKTLTGQVATIGLSPEENITARFERENELLRQAREQDILTEQDFITKKETLEAQHQENLKKLRDKASEEVLLNLQALENRAIGAFASVIVGAQSGSDAVRGLATSILNEAVGGLIKMGLETVKNTVLSESLEKAKQTGIVTTAAVSQTATAASTATQVAAAATVATAAAPAAALTSTYSFGQAALIGGAAVLGTIALVKGAREHGGPVTAGDMFQVGEGGKPEIFTSGGKNFMIPGDNGKVISNKDAFGGEQQVQMNVNIENNVSNANVKTQMSDDGKNLRIFINEVANQINTNQGQIPRALRNSTNTNFKANR